MAMQNEKGIALLLVLWIITLLTVICAEFAWTMRTETTIVRNFKEGEQAYYVAEAGINKAIIELMRIANKKQTATKTEDTEEEEKPLWETGSAPIQFRYGAHLCEITIEDESNKININSFLKSAKKNPVALKQLLEDKIGLEGEERDIVADSMLDWWDTDHNITGVNGTEDEYYRSLDDPYECADGPLKVIEELLLIRGIDEKIYYGDQGAPEQTAIMTTEDLNALLNEGQVQDEPVERQPGEDQESDEEAKRNLGLANIFTIYSNANDFSININTASLNQLLLLDGMDTATAQEIIRERQEREFVAKDPRLLELRYDTWQRGSAIKSGRRVRFFSVTARGFAGEGPVSRTIQCITRITRSKSYILNWKELI